jgi:hypothetical protein
MAERTSTFEMFLMGVVRYRVYEFEFGNKLEFRLLESAYTMYSIASKFAELIFRPQGAFKSLLHSSPPGKPMVFPAPRAKAHPGDRGTNTCSVWNT